MLHVTPRARNGQREKVATKGGRQDGSKWGDKPTLKPVRTPVAILGSLGVCIYVPASRHWLISYSPIHLT